MPASADRQQSQPRGQIEPQRPIERQRDGGRQHDGGGQPEQSFDQQVVAQPAANVRQAAQHDPLRVAQIVRHHHVFEGQAHRSIPLIVISNHQAIRERFRRIHSSVNNTIRLPNTIGASHNSLRYSSSRPTCLTLNASGICS